MSNVILSQLGSNSEPEYKLYPGYFSDRDIKGYNGELLVKNKLDCLDCSYKSNPLDNILVWKQYQAKGPDFRVNGNIELEVKNTDRRIFPSWIIRDWIPRFSYHNETRVASAPIGIKLSVQSMELLFNRNINLCYFDSLKYLTPNRANKLVEATDVEPYTVLNESSNNYSLKPKKSQKHSLNIAKTETLNQYLMDIKNGKPENKEGHSKPKLNCYNCIKRDNCNILSEIEHLKAMRPQIFLVQSNITDNLKDRKNIDKENLKNRRREWLKEYGKVQIKQIRCLNKRVYLHLNMNYKLFSTGPDKSNHKV